MQRGGRDLFGELPGAGEFTVVGRVEVMMQAWRSWLRCPGHCQSPLSERGLISIQRGKELGPSSPPRAPPKTGCVLITTWTLGQILFSACLSLRENNLWEVCSQQLGPQWCPSSCVHIWHAGGGLHAPFLLEVLWGS